MNCTAVDALHLVFGLQGGALFLGPATRLGSASASLVESRLVGNSAPVSRRVISAGEMAR